MKNGNTIQNVFAKIGAVQPHVTRSERRR